MNSMVLDVGRGREGRVKILTGPGICDLAATVSVRPSLILVSRLIWSTITITAVDALHWLDTHSGTRR